MKYRLFIFCVFSFFVFGIAKIEASGYIMQMPFYSSPINGAYAPAPNQIRPSKASPQPNFIRLQTLPVPFISQQQIFVCPDYLGDTFACVPSPRNFIPGSNNFLPTVTNKGGGPCPDYLGDTFACVQSPANFFAVPGNLP